MRVVVVTPPDPVIELEEAKAHLRVDGGDDDALIKGMIAAAIGHIDGPNGWLGRAIGVQTLDAFLDDFGAGSLRLPYPPTIDVLEVVYTDVAGAPSTIDPTGYQLRGSELVAAWGQSWPATRCQPEALRVRYKAGFETAPAAIKAAILLMVGDLYRRRDTTADVVTASVPISVTVGALLFPFRVYA